MVDWTGFERFDRRRGRGGHTPTLAVAARGRFLTLNLAAYAALGRPDRAELLFDRAARVIAIRPVAAATSSAFVVRRVPRSQTWHIGADKFCAAYGLTPARSRPYTARVQDGVLFADVGANAATD